MEKNATDFALMASAFSTDHKMATQVCRLLADGDVNEATARKMLRLVGAGKLASETQTCSHWHWYYPQYITWNTPCSTGNAIIDGPSFTSTTTSLTSMANAALEAAA